MTPRRCDRTCQTGACAPTPAPSPAPTPAPTTPRPTTPAPSPLPTAAAQHCGDAAFNFDETDVDCGGDDCAPCAVFGSCATDADCATGLCAEVEWGAGSYAYELADGGGGAYSYEGVFVHTTFKYALILLPILNGVLITLKSQLDPETKANALAWADAKMVSETYKYRARALQYSASSGSGWVSDREKRKRGGKQLAAKTYTEQCKDINTVLRSDSTFSHAALSGTTDQEQVLDMRKKKLADVSSGEAETCFSCFDCCFAICFTGVFGFCCPTKEPETTVIKVDLEEIDVRDGQPKQKSFVDDGYSRLDASEYLACRTQLHLNRMKQEVVPASRWLTSLKILTLIFTTVSVALGSINLDLFIAVSTAIVSFFTTFMCASRCPLLRLGRRL